MKDLLSVLYIPYIHVLISKTKQKKEKRNLNRKTKNLNGLWVLYIIKTILKHDVIFFYHFFFML